MAGHDLGLDAELVEKRAEPHAQRLHAHQIEFGRLGRAGMAEPPARVIFAKAGRRHERRHLEGKSVGSETGGRFRQHPAIVSRNAWRSSKAANDRAEFATSATQM